ncbi:MAG: acyltransferase [bacterium]|nr:acyltransferase [bacterium]
MKDFLRRHLKAGSLARWLAVGFYWHPWLFIFAVIKSVIATKKLTGRYYPVKVRIGAGQSLKVSVENDASIKIDGIFSVDAWGGSCASSSIVCGTGSAFITMGDFQIGPNVHISVSDGAKLSLGGKKYSSGSGVTCDSRIMVERSLDIGYDCIIAWNVYITDSDWHNISGVDRCSPVLIGDHVWISHGVSILKGAVIPSGCIVGAKSLVANVFEAEKSLIAGVPAKVIKAQMEWSR